MSGLKKLVGVGRKKKSDNSSAPGDGGPCNGYIVKEKDLSKVHKAAWTGDLVKLKQLTKKSEAAVRVEHGR